MTDLPKSVVFIAGAVIGLVASVMFSGGMNLSGVYNQVNNTFREGIKAGASDQFYVETDGDVVTSGDVTISGGQLTVPTTANASSTLVIGQVQTYATSSATVVCQKYLAVATTSSNGFVTWSYGACP